CIPEPLETIFFMDGTKNVDAGERELMNQLATNIASSLPDQSTVGVYSLDYQAKEIESFTKTSHGHSWSIIVPIRNEMKRYGNYISMKALDNEIKARYPAKRYSPKAEIFILFVSDESKLDDVVPLFLAKKKTFVVVFGSYIPSIYKSIASRKDHLYLVRKKEEVSYVSFSIIKRIKCDSRFNCDTDKYSLQKGAGCKSCFYICGAKLGDLTIVCKTRCPYLRLSTKSSHEDFVEEAALKSHKEDNKEALKSHEEDNTSLHAIIILCRYMFIACGVYCCYRCPRGCRRYLRSRLARLKRLKNKAFRTLDVEGWNTLTLSYPITSIETAHVYIRVKVESGNHNAVCLSIIHPYIVGAVRNSIIITMNLQKLISTREGQRRLISIQLDKFNNELSQSEKTALLEIMEEKAEIIKNLNEKIVNHPDVDDLETELVDSDEYSIDLRLKLRKLKEDITKSSDVKNDTVILDSQDFNGSARTVSDTTSTAIAGFPLTNANYQNAIDLLQERFGQSHKIIDTYMQSLLDLPIPDNNVASLRRFHDIMENYIRGLESLEGLAEKLKLKHTGSDTISLASFGGKSEQCRYIPTGRVFLHVEQGETIPLDVLIVPTIAVPLPNLQQEVKCMNYIRSLKLAYPLSDADDDFEVSLLIGADYYWQIVQN
ncbi:uncharacterized protein LOC128551402, partial [Mercenaria mercenaria]|uniref:uncharacterized protein LOC128551402 n=1 Tax=Mercenaria mercenaria TaxID=6596 RepID=UPI00234F0F34